MELLFPARCVVLFPVRVGWIEFRGKKCHRIFPISGIHPVRGGKKHQEPKKNNVFKWVYVERRCTPTLKNFWQWHGENGRDTFRVRHSQGRYLNGLCCQHSLVLTSVSTSIRHDDEIVSSPSPKLTAPNRMLLGAGGWLRQPR